MVNMSRRLVCCWLIALAVVSAVSAADTPYEVRLWRRAGTSSIGYHVTYRSVSEMYSRLQEDGWITYTASWAYQNSGSWALCNNAMAKCELASQLYSATPWHHFGAGYGWGGYNGIFGHCKSKNIWLMGPSASNHTVTNMFTTIAYKIRRCQACAGETSYPDSSRAIEYDMAVYVVDPTVVPEWAWTNPNFKNMTPTFNENYSQITGYSGEIDTGKAPRGAIQTGEHQNGDWVLGENGPEWQWFPGMEPQLTAEETQANMDGLKAAVDGLAAGVSQANGTLTGMADTLSGLKAAMDVSNGMWASHFADLLAALNGLSTPEPFNDAAILSAIGSVGSAVAGVRSEISSQGSAVRSAVLETTAAVNGLRSDQNGHWASLGDNMVGWVSDGVGGVKASADAVKTSTDAVKTSVDSVKGSVDGVKTSVDDLKLKSDGIVDAVNGVKTAVEGARGEADGAPLVPYVAVPLEPFEVFTEHDIDTAEPAGLNDAEFASTFSLLGGLEDKFIGIQGKIVELGNGLVGSWKNIGSVPYASIPFQVLWVDTVIDLTLFNDFWAKVRPIEVICIWALFLFAAMRLILSAFGGN